MCVTHAQPPRPVIRSIPHHRGNRRGGIPEMAHKLRASGRPGLLRDLGAAAARRLTRTHGESGQRALGGDAPATARDLRRHGDIRILNDGRRSLIKYGHPHGGAEALERTTLEKPERVCAHRQRRRHRRIMAGSRHILGQPLFNPGTRYVVRTGNDVARHKQSWSRRDEESPPEHRGSRQERSKNQVHHFALSRHSSAIQPQHRPRQG